MNITIFPRRLSGTVTPPGSKSMAHRLLIAAALASGTSTVRAVTRSEDVGRTLCCLEALGARWSADGSAYRVTGTGARSVARTASALPRMDCGESASTLRFLIPVALAVSGGGVFTGRGRLMQRPHAPYRTLFDEKRIFYRQDGDTLTVRGTLKAGRYQLPGDVSSQFFTGLLFALSALDGESVLESLTPLQSAPYVSMTLEALAKAGVHVTPSDGPRFRIRGQPCRAFRAAVEGDWSQAAFWYAANFLGGDVEIRGLNPVSAQGDRAVTDLFRRLKRRGDVEIDVSDCPDLLPPLAVMSAVRHGSTRFVRAQRLRLKESDRLRAMSRLLRALGGRAEEGPDFLRVAGGGLRGGTVDGQRDHRIIMAAAVAACACADPVTILGAEAVRKSYPAFWDDYQCLGGSVHVL